MPNNLAFAILLAWPIICIFFYKRFNTVTATFLTIVGGYLILPAKTDIDLPLIPAFDKFTIPALVAFFYCNILHKTNITILPKTKFLKVITILLLLSPFFTVINNSEPYFNGNYWIQGMSLYDSVSVVMRQYLLLLPLIIASNIVKTNDDITEIYKLVTLAGIFYSPFILLEVRLSPQLHTWVYGFFPHSFLQQIRYDGFRPVVFLGHGLLVGIFLFSSFAAACSLWNSKIRIFKEIHPLALVIYFFVLLVLTKAIGALLFAILLFILVIINSVKLYKIVIYSALVLVISYPMLCIFSIFPHDLILDFLYDIEPNRAQSLGFRFYHENLLIEHASNKLLFGWGSWGRNMLAGSITDGRWIIEFGRFGIVGFLLIFSLAVFVVYKATKKSNGNLIFLVTLSFLLIDQLLNDSLSSWIWFLLGSLVTPTFNQSGEKQLPYKLRVN